MTKEQLDRGKGLINIITGCKNMLQLHTNCVLRVNLMEVRKDGDIVDDLYISPGLYRLLQDATVCSITAYYNAAIKEFEEL